MITIRINVLDRTGHLLTAHKFTGEPGEPIPEILDDDTLILSSNVPEVFPEMNTLYRVILITNDEVNIGNMKMLLASGAVLATTAIVARHLIKKLRR